MEATVYVYCKKSSLESNSLNWIFVFSTKVYSIHFISNFCVILFTYLELNINFNKNDKKRINCLFVRVKLKSRLLKKIQGTDHYLLSQEAYDKSIQIMFFYKPCQIRQTLNYSNLIKIFRCLCCKTS